MQRDAIGDWKPGAFLIAASHGVVTVPGWHCGGLAMSCDYPASPKGRRPPRWSLTHIRTGHRVVYINAHGARAFDLATQIVQLGDWGFTSLDGWKNTDPELPNKMLALKAATGKALGFEGSGEDRNYETAREIAAQMETA